MQHNLRDPSRDQAHGRVYRVVMAGKPTVQPVPVAGRPVADLVRLLADPTDRVRYRARLELAGRQEAEVVPAVKAWLAGLDSAAAEFEHHRLEALWMLRHFDQVDVPLLEAVLSSRDHRARAAGMRVLAAIVDRVPQALDMVRRASADESLRVRLEALRTASYLRRPEAIESLAIVEELPSDGFMDYVKKEAARVLRPEYERARQAGERMAFTTPAGQRFFYASLSNDELAREPRSPGVYRAMLLRPGLDERLRTEAVEGIAKADGVSVVRVASDALRALDGRDGDVDSGVVFDLIRLLLARPKQELAELRADMEKLATTATRPVMRRIGYVGLMTIDAAAAGGGDPSARAWELASADPRRLVDVVEALPLVGDPGVAGSLYERMLPLLDAGGSTAATPGTTARFVRIELPGNGRTLTLAEVEIFADGQNVARQGRATQINTANGGDAARAIDGNASGTWGDGGQTHTAEGTANPWWEVDLGGPRRIERIVVHNRTEENLGSRLDGFTLRLLDEGRGESFRLEKQPAPRPKAEIAVASEADVRAAAVRRAVFGAIVGVKGREQEAFKRIATFVRQGVDRDAGIRALSRIPVAAWPADEAPALVAALVESMRKASAEERSSDAGLAAWQFAETLTTLLPPAEGKARRAELADLGVRVVRIGTVYERMAYDRETVAVQAGKPVLFVLENADVMPHNFVITKPGRMQAVGEAAEAQAQNPDFAKQNFVPKSPDVLVASTLMQPQAVVKVNFQAPSEPGVYPYVCTYPGHWRRMFGALYVVDDLESYLADPAAHLAAKPLEIRDELLKDRRPRTEWTLADIESDVAAMEKGRSFAHGRELFRTASCVACHKLGSEGNAFGPELAKLDAKMTAVEIARHVLEPSLRIDEKYRSTTIVTGDGRSITGLVVAETPTDLAIVENPVAKAEPLRLATAAIEARSTSPVSIMPKGLLDKLSRDEVLDLLAYVAARGDESNCLFNPDGCPHHGAKPVAP